MTRERILDGDALIRGSRWSFAYYVAGYAVECGLKSCLLAQMIHTGLVFREKVKIDEYLTHDFRKLVDLAGLTAQLNGDLAASAAGTGTFAANWQVVNQWKVTSRYESKTESEARALYAAVTDDPEGVLKWIMPYW